MTDIKETFTTHSTIPDPNVGSPLMAIVIFVGVATLVLGGAALGVSLAYWLFW